MTTFVLPQELYPIQIRTTFNGIAAATGKVTPKSVILSTA